MPSYNIYDAAAPETSIATIEAPDAVDALAEYSISQGYADPRTLEDGPDYFNVWFDGTQAMAFENTELVAVPA